MSHEQGERGILGPDGKPGHGGEGVSLLKYISHAYIYHCFSSFQGSQRHSRS